jgi:hypothetical protein
MFQNNTCIPTLEISKCQVHTIVQEKLGCVYCRLYYHIIDNGATCKANLPYCLEQSNKNRLQCILEYTLKNTQYIFTQADFTNFIALRQKYIDAYYSPVLRLV